MPDNDLPARLRQQRWEVGARIRAIRTEQALSQLQLQERCGVDNKTISRYENGMRNIGIDDLARLADGLGVPVWRLFRDD